MNNVLCVKWGDLYNAEYVNNLYAMVKRNLTTPFRFVCLTDNERRIHKNIETKPLTDKTLEGWWTKIAFFQSPLFDIDGPCLTLDLDTVIVDNIDCFFEYKQDSFCMKWDYGQRHKKYYGYSSCVMRFEAGQYPNIYNRLNLTKMEHSTHSTKPGFNKRKQRYWGDQVWITDQLKNENVELWPKNWVRKFTRDCHRDPKTKQIVDEQIRPNGPIRAKDFDMKTQEFFVPTPCKIIVFSGIYKNHKERKKIDKWWHCKDL